MNHKCRRENKSLEYLGNEMHESRREGCLSGKEETRKKANGLEEVGK